MKNLLLLLLVVASAIVMMVSTLTAEETVTGRLVEAGCSAMAGAEPSAEHVACMVRCAKNGDPIGILTANGLYKITGDWATNNPDQLAEFMAKQVHATGEASEVNGEVLFEVSRIQPAD